MRISDWSSDVCSSDLSVDYSGLASSPSHALAQTYLPRGQGSVFAVTLRGGRAAAAAVVDALRLFTRMTHLGDVRSLVLHPASTTHALRAEGERVRAGIDPGLLRLSIRSEERPVGTEGLSTCCSPWSQYH